MVNNMKDERILKEQHKLIIQLIERRKKLGFSQQQVAELANLPQSQIARMEREYLSPRLDTMIKIGEILGIEFSFIKK